LAAPEGYIRAFLDEGAAMAELLPRLRNLDPACSDFVDVLIRASAGVKHVARDARTIGPGLAHDLARGDARNRQLDEPLSEQEMRILRLLAAPMTNLEVAGELVVTVGTVKWHLHNIYGKLGVESRAQAVARARRLGLLA
jgi:LuxR family maltose regulon positive regulatory protein